MEVRTATSDVRADIVLVSFNFKWAEKLAEINRGRVNRDPLASVSVPFFFWYPAQHCHQSWLWQKGTYSKSHRTIILGQRQPFLLLTSLHKILRVTLPTLKQGRGPRSTILCSLYSKKMQGKYG